MLPAYRLRLVSRWLGPLLVVFLALGHACELPAFADQASHGAEDFHHSANDHGDEHLTSCDGVGVASSPSYAHVGSPYLDVAEGLLGVSPAPVQLSISSVAGWNRLPSRPPLFLLHASLLI